MTGGNRGRPECFWASEFETKTQDDGSVLLASKHCNKILSYKNTKATRKAQHPQTCISAPIHLQERLESESAAGRKKVARLTCADHTSRQASSSTLSVLDTSEAIAPVASSKGPVQSRFVIHSNKITKKESAAADQRLVEFLVGCGLSFRTINTP